MANVEIYASMFCGFCYRAKQLLDQKGVAYTEIDVTMNPVRRREMAKRASGQTSVPQIFIDEMHVPFLILCRITRVFKPLKQTIIGRLAETELIGQYDIDVTVAIDVVRRRIDTLLGNRANYILLPARILIPDELGGVIRKRYDIA